MTRIAITGGIGSGKSYVCKLLKDRGIKIYDCDEAAKRLIRTSDTIQKGLSVLVGDNIFIDGHLNKAALSTFLLESEDNALKINAIVHPEVAKDFLHSGYEWMECAILFESGFDKLVDKKILVSAPLEIRIQRVMTRDSITRKGVMEWMQRQWSEESVRERCDFEINNDGIADLNKQIDIILNQL